MKKINFFSALIVLSVPLNGLSAGESAAQREAAGYYEAGRTSKALETCIAALKRDPPDEGLYAYALEILPEGPSKYAGPLRDIAAKASALKPESYIYYLGLCKLTRGAGQPAEALSNCKKARALDPTSLAVYRELGLTYSRNGDNDRALETLTQGVDLSSGNYKAYYYLAAEYERRKEFPAALKNYRKALALLKTGENADRRTYSKLIRGRINICSGAITKATGHRTPNRLTNQPADNPAAGKSAVAAPEKLFEICMKEAEDLKKADDPVDMEKKLSACAALAPRNPQPITERAGFLIRLGKYEEAAVQYRKAAGLFPGNDPMAAFCHIKTAQTYSKLNDIPKTILHYEKALEINKNDLNALMGLAAVTEARADFKAAGALYIRVLKAEPSNAKARERLDEINFNLLSDSQRLEELRGRRGADEKKTAFSAEDLKLLKAIHRAERNGAVDYLKARTSYTKGLIMEKKEQDHIKLMLTLAGFKSYQNYQTRDAVSFFEKKAINLRDVFTLRDLNGTPFFAPGGRLTIEGMESYWAAQQSGNKTWLLPYETVSRSPEDDTLNAQTEEFLKNGFKEISEPEYFWLMKVTSCPDEVLQTPPCGVKLLKTSKTRKYFLCYSQTAPCFTQAAQILAGYVERYRANNTWIPENTGASAFFGSGGGEQHRFCHKGKIWTGN
ncbi:MAG: hypothetical protein A2270_02380 [Elusimicrobia bacterium RIFOXYA12_FULL_51_18]|nr:MAG: hypothetical protein A2270_02380 [Elusimicrobia bacterium RIFOXYA12_FULL_51_18]OGS31261.1 MAG: hypothetical protein A2218_07965 [Elusimicrobia bacterium RIFOXYA2_FULL_53_38]